MNTVDAKTQEHEVEFFKALIRIKTISAEGHKGAYKACADFLEAKCKQLDMATKQVELVPGKPILIATLAGTRPDLPCLVLNSHYDVVPVMEDHWSVPAFAAVEKEGRIYGRGTQDMKCVCAQYLMAMQRMRAAASGALRFLRTVHLTYVPDEEIGGKDGMAAFLLSPEYRELGPIALALDEGLASPDDLFTVFYGERAPLWLMVTAEGATGHGSRFIADTAVQRLLGVANKAFEFRLKEEQKLGYPQQRAGCAHCEAKKLGDVTTLNLTMLQAGVTGDEGQTWSLNVIPTTAKAGFDIRVPPSVPIAEITSMLDAWTAEEGLSWAFVPWAGVPPENHHLTSIDPDKNPFWAAFKGNLEKQGHRVVPEVFPAGTDSRLLRQLGVPALGFSPMRLSPIMLHEHDEFLDRKVYLEGVGVYVGLVPSLANLPPQPGETTA